MIRCALAAIVTLSAAPAFAGELRDLCPDRPGLGTPPCTVDAGHVMIETGLVDWTHDRRPESATDSWLIGATLVRFGLGATTEAQLEWSPLGHIRERDRTTGAADHVTRAGDVSLAVRQNLRNPDGSGVSFALQPFVTVPLGRRPIGAGDWGAGILAPASFELSKTFKLGFTPEIDAAVDEDGDGRHLAYGGVAGVTADLTATLGVTAEIEAMRDRDPAEHSTEARAGLSAGWQASDDLQFDAGSNVGLNRDTPDVELYAGVSRRF